MSSAPFVLLDIFCYLKRYSDLVPIYFQLILLFRILIYERRSIGIASKKIGNFVFFSKNLFLFLLYFSAQQNLALYWPDAFIYGQKPWSQPQKLLEKHILLEIAWILPDCSIFDNVSEHLIDFLVATKCVQSPKMRANIIYVKAQSTQNALTVWDLPRILLPLEVVPYSQGL